jgi:hypothetical protein
MPGRDLRYWHHRLHGLGIGQVFDQDALRFRLQRTGRRQLLGLLHEFLDGFDETGCGHGVLRVFLWWVILHCSRMLIFVDRMVNRYFFFGGSALFVEDNQAEPSVAGEDVGE